MENNSIDIKDKIVSQQTHGTSDITCGGSLESPTHRLSKKIEKSIFDNLSLMEPTEEERDFIYRDEDENVMVASKESGKTKTVWKLVESMDELSVGDKVIITSDQPFLKAISTVQNSNNRGASDISLDEEGYIEEPEDDVQIITLEYDNNNNGWLLHCEVGTIGYLSGVVGNNNYLRTVETPGIIGVWEITINASKQAIIQSTDILVRRNTIRYNNQSMIFSCYASTGQSAVYLYKRTSVTIPDYYTWKGLISNDDAIPQETLNEIFRPMCNDRNLIEECCDEETGYVIDCEDDTQTGE